MVIVSFKTFTAKYVPKTFIFIAIRLEAGDRINIFTEIGDLNYYQRCLHTRPKSAVKCIIKKRMKNLKNHPSKVYLYTFKLMYQQFRSFCNQMKQLIILYSVLLNAVRELESLM